ncbi:MAG: hypothetical protein CNC89_01005 [Puniceicoccaceae bacterium MED-G31]|nr:hypothetical protein [Coraliomargarita sp.]PDH30333.1 MAG: hypothetical protein CNC89_01005 [Puniceicoccaceae bacterium MED-G31]
MWQDPWQGLLLLDGAFVAQQEAAVRSLSAWQQASTFDAHAFVIYAAVSCPCMQRNSEIKSISTTRIKL